MSPKGQVLLSITSFLCCLAVSYFIFSKWGPRTDIGAYGVSFVALFFAYTAFAFAYSLRRRWSMRILCVLEGLAVAFWSLEFFGGVGWFVLDRVARHYQQR
jgi:hypothetical protein